jgi:hypothetical protein
MTTHYVELRPSTQQVACSSHRAWFALTLKPVTEQAALDLCKVIGPHWESRVVPASSVDQEEIVRASSVDLWKLFDEFPRWKKIDAHHHPDCESVSVMQWSTVMSVTLTGGQWLLFHRMEDAVKVARARAASMGIIAWGYDEAKSAYDRTVILGAARDHTARCPGCGAEAKAVSVQVSIMYGCRQMVREYAL